MTKTLPETLRSVLVIGGCPYEAIDGIRHYANHARPRWHGHNMAKYLVENGVKVTLITPPTLYMHHPDINYIDRYQDHHISNAQTLCDAVIEEADKHPYDAIIQLANIASVRAVETSKAKLKVKNLHSDNNDIILDICANIDIIGRIQEACPEVPCVGYDENQHWVALKANSVAKAFKELLDQTLLAPAPDFTSGVAYPQTSTHELTDKKIIITSGPTVEFITPHGDCISNFSSGKQGYAIANALACMGAHITLVSGPVQLPPLKHPNISTLYVESSQQMHSAVMHQLPADGYIGVAAVADFYMPTPLSITTAGDQVTTLSLQQNPDILRNVANHKTRPRMVIGFAAESNNIENYAQDKLKRKNLDAICANHAQVAGTDHNHITWITSDEIVRWKSMSKIAAAQQIGLAIAAMLND